MNKTFLARIAALACGMLLSFSALAAGGGNLQQAGTDIGDRASLQRGAQLFMNYCAGCHSLKHLRYSRMAEDLGLTEEEVMTNLNFTGASCGGPIVSSIPAEPAGTWFGQVPPGLSPGTRVPGRDWVSSFMESVCPAEARPL